MAYPLETVLAEKLETVISRATLNSRMRDFYDIQVLCEEYRHEIDKDMLGAALSATAEKRGSLHLLNDTESVLCAIEASSDLRQLWQTYRRKYKYAERYDWSTIIRSVRGLAIDAGLSVKKPSMS